MMPSPADLAYFVETAHTLNISRAAERLGISQPSLSLALQRLEHSIGAPLLTRGKRGVTLTQAGKQLLAHAKNLLQSWEEVKAAALSSVNEIRGSYTIGCHPSVALNTLSGFLPALMAQHPQLNITLRHDLSRKVAEDVVSHKVDIGIIVNPVPHPDLVIHQLCKDDVTLWTGEKANKGVLIYDPDLIQSQTLLKKMKKSGLTFSRVIISSSLEVIADLTAHGCGTGILPARVALQARQKLTRIQKAPVFYDEYCLIFRVENKNVRSIQALSQAIRKLFHSS